MAVRICPKCGGKCSTSRNTCIHCGYIFDETKVCPDCGATLESGASECKECGYIFPTSKVTSSDFNNPEVNNGKNSKANVLSVTCPNCGASSSHQIGEDKYLCDRCGSSFIVNKGPKTIVNGNVIINQVNDEKRKVLSLDKFDKCIKYEFSHSKKEFKEEVGRFLFEKACPKETYNNRIPFDILDYDLGEVGELYVDYIYLEGEAEVDYSCSIGYNDVEEYIDYEFDSNGKPYKVTRTRNTVDWKPYNGHIVDSSKGFYPNSNRKVLFENNLYVEKIDFDDCEDLKYSVIENSDIPFADGVELLCSNLKRDVIPDLPGDCYGSLSYSGKLYPHKFNLVKIPVFRVKISYKGHNFYLLSPGIGKLDIQFGLCQPEYESTYEKRISSYNHQLSIASVLLKVTIALLVVSFISFCFFGLSLTKAGIDRTKSPYTIVFFVSAFFMAINFAGIIVINVVWKRLVKKAKKNIISDTAKRVVDSYNNWIKRNVK